MDASFKKKITRHACAVYLDDLVGRSREGTQFFHKLHYACATCRRFKTTLKCKNVKLETPACTISSTIENHRVFSRLHWCSVKNFEPRWSYSQFPGLAGKCRECVVLFLTIEFPYVQGLLKGAFVRFDSLTLD